jgi:predicted AlkP superfamily phosphohydrolase/phosphomutase
MSTGAHPSTNGIEGFLLHRPGRRLDDRISGVYADRLTAEPIWQTAVLNGLASYVVKFPVSYPSTATLRIDGAAGWGGLTCLHEVAASGTTVWPVDPHGAIAEGPAWTGAPATDLTPRWFATLSLANVWGRAPITFALAISTRGDTPVLSIAGAPDWRAVGTSLLQGEWSEPIIVAAANRRDEIRPCATRFKARGIATDPIRLQLFNTPLHERDGHSSPDLRWQRHLRAAGPIEEQTDPMPLFSGAIDLATHVERCRLNTDWLGRVSRSILRGEQWNLFMVQTHIVDWAHHILHGAIDPRHPLHDSRRADEADSLLRLFYSMADELVTAVIEAAGEDVNVIVMGDHGQDLHHTTVRFNCWLAEAGYLTFLEGGDVDWSRTRACVVGNGVYLNLRGRDPEGIVERHEAEPLIEAICQGLLAATDPRTGERVVLVAGPREHFAYLGGHGCGTGDILFCFASGYQARNDRGPMFEVTVPWTEFTSGHDHFWPLDPRIQTRMFAAGPAFAAPARAPRLRPIIDVAPTVCAILGIDPPPTTDGSAISDILAAPSSALQPMEA